MYLKVALDRNQLDGTNSRQIAADLDLPLEKVNDGCQLLEDRHFAHIDKRNMKQGKPVDLVAHITPEGIDYLAKENGIPL